MQRCQISFSFKRFDLFNTVSKIRSQWKSSGNTSPPGREAAVAPSVAASQQQGGDGKGKVEWLFWKMLRLFSEFYASLSNKSDISSSFFPIQSIPVNFPGKQFEFKFNDFIQKILPNAENLIPSFNLVQIRRASKFKWTFYFRLIPSQLIHPL